MSIYFQDKVKQYAEEHMEKDLNSFRNEPPIMPSGYILEQSEFNLFWIVFQASQYSNTKDFFDHWTFYLSDDVAEEIIFEDDDLNKMYSEPYDFSIEECLEEAKEKHLIDGFCDLGNDLWLIKDRGD